MILTRASWELDMALKAVRDSETAAEQSFTMDVARARFHVYDHSLERIKAGPCQWFRYGRIGNVLKNFWTSAHNR